MAAPISGRKVVGGRVQSRVKAVPSKTRAELSRVFIWQLEDALIATSIELENLWCRGAITRQIADLTIQMFQTANQKLDATLRHARVGAPQTLANSKSLLKDTQLFRAAIKPMMRSDLPCAEELANCIHELCCDIEHYARQVKITHKIVRISSDRLSKPANRPTNWLAKAELAVIINQHQDIHGSESFPKPRQIKAALARVNLSIPDRTLRKWLEQMRLNTFSHHIQPRKRQ
jgi:hypothetical protein